MDAVEDIKSRLNIEDVVAEYVQLKRAGRNFRGLSPFSSEKTPSFMVSPEKQIWHDFSSGKGGNMFSFVMEMEGLDFKGALEHLARKAGVDLAQYRTGTNTGREDQKKKLYEILDLTTKFYQTHFSKNQQAIDYIVKKRGMDKATALKFKVGYSPEGPSALATFLKSKNYKFEDVKAAGLVSQRGSDVVDMFRGRLMIPLMDSFGQVIGFTARILNDDPKAPKYINTPSTIIYDKSRHVFGLHLAKESIRKTKYVVVAEGNMDVIASHQAGINNVVATAGTAMTEQHIKTLNRITPDIRLAFDQDNAGIAAAERSIPLAAKLGVNLSVITIPSGKDPDELIQKSPKLWTEIITKPEYAVDWLINRYQNLLDLSSAQGKKQFSDTLLNIINRLPDQVEQEHFVQKIADILGVSTLALTSKLQKSQPALRKSKITEQQKPQANLEAIKSQDQLLAIALLKPEMRYYLQNVTLTMLPQANAKKLLSYLQKSPKASAKNVSEVQDLTEYGKILELQFEELYGDVDDIELQYEANRQLSRLVENYVKTQKKELSAQLDDASESETRKLLEEVKLLDALLNKLRREIK